VLFAVVFFVYGGTFFYLYAVSFFFFLRLFRYDKVLFAFALFICLVSLWPSQPAEAVDEGVVVHSERGREHPRFRLKGDEGTFVVYSETPVHTGEAVRIEATRGETADDGFFGGFDYGRHLRAEGIDGVLFADDIERIERPFTPYALRGAIERYIERTFAETKAYMYTFVLAERSFFTEDLTGSVSRLGIAHFFAVSGLHVGLLSAALYKGLSLVHTGWGRDVVLSVFLLLFLLVSGFQVSVMRAVLMAWALLLNKRFSLGFTPVDVLAVLALAFIGMRSEWLYHSGFLLSFGVSLGLLLMRPAFKGGAFRRVFTVAWTAFLISMPLVLSMQGGVNAWAVGFNMVYGVFTTMCFLPLVYLTFCLPFLEPILALAAGVFERSLNVLGLTVFTVALYIPAGGVRLVYYLLLARVYQAYILNARLFRAVCVFAGFLLLVALSPFLTPYTEVTMFNVRGDAFLLRDAFNRCNILIDTGEGDPHDSLVRAIQRLNVRRLDYVFLTHRHTDHYGEYDDVAAHFSIGNTVTNVDQDRYEDEVHACGAFSFYIYPLEWPHRGENDRSILMWIDVAGERYLFTGDIEGPRERTILDTYEVGADVLKVPHHGSITSSSEAFLRAVSADTALVPADRDNPFDHPHPEVIARLKRGGMEAFTLAEDGSVRFHYIFSRRFESTAFP